jgi:4-diphosphocytidyl-2-C-methyl-D-erythritol kinase
LDKTSQADPLTLLEKISRNGISQDVCINDLGMNLQILELVILLFSFPEYEVIFLSFSNPPAFRLGKPARKPLFVLDV